MTTEPRSMTDTRTPDARLREAATTRFWPRVRKSDGCWEWTGALTKGYGTITIARAAYRVHRFSWMIHRGPIPDGLMVCHRCDNRACVRPDHLFVGTATANNRDRDGKGRRAPNGGPRHPQSKLTWEVVDAVRAASGSYSEIGREFGISKTTVWKVRWHLSYRDDAREAA